MVSAAEQQRNKKQTVTLTDKQACFFLHYFFVLIFLPEGPSLHSIKQSYSLFYLQEQQQRVKKGE